MKKLAIYFLAFYLIVSGIVSLSGFSFEYLPLILAVIQLVTGVLLLLAGKRLKSFHHLGNLCLSVVLMLSGLISLTAIHFSAQTIVLGILTLVAGILLPVGMKSGRFSQHLGTIFVSAWLILKGLTVLISLSFTGINWVTAVIAIAAGVLLGMGKR